ncbi:MAG: YihY/virulence factor BrkB family protein [Rhodospirillales bacterium]|nr:YihY/virulence factor BrkB family protein [Alphaproteobacteria bacterium]MCB9986388.1 YihY/virulence factor BrkB family protein [Rhodospirillales bacterium]USO07064.1 MAG: YihY/virulence factor BrkB family protein [Rhodospirillales bacterium]
MRRIGTFFRHWITIARMSSGELAAMTLPPWVLTALHVRNEVKQDYIGLVAAGVAFYFLLAAFPALAAAVSIFGLVVDPVLITDQINMMNHILPGAVVETLTQQITHLTASTDRSLSISLALSVLITLYSATRGTSALIKGFNIAYNCAETRGLIRLTLLSYGLTFLMLGYLLASLLLVAGLPAAIQILHVPDDIADKLQWLRWAMLFGAALIGLEVLYTFGPCRRRRGFGISAGGIAATAMWVAGSGAFSLFVSHFPSYNQTYGSLGAVAVLMIWFWVSALTILIGAEINGALEARTTKKPSG